MSDKSAKDVFIEAMELTGAERDTFIKRSCKDDEKLLATVKQLLGAHDEDSRFLEESPLKVDLNEVARWAHPDELLVGEQINGWTIDRVIAAGGMGTVYQASGKNNGDSVAIKIMRSGVASENAMQRFRFESDVLAHLNHDGIARVLESGTHDDGLGGVPFFVMEYVPDALPITEYSQARDLNLHQRVELLAQVCDAIHHGHQKGVIHRDLKPANILVDSSNRPKVIDFGVARATDSDLALTSIATSAGDLLGTLQYMSPEQCGTDPSAVDIRSDIYSLGVVLYELICGVFPYDVREVGVMEAVRRIRESKPLSPRQARPGIPEDLSTIVVKALEKEPQRRYQSAVELAADLRRFLHNEPIMARPPSAIYQLRKFARRNKLLFSAASIVVLVLIGSTVVSSLALARESQQREIAEQQRNEATQQSEYAEDVTDFLIQDMLIAVDPRRKGVDVTVREVLDEAAAAVGTRFGDDPVRESIIRLTIGVAYSELGLFAQAEDQLSESLRIANNTNDVRETDRLLTMTNLANVYLEEDRYREAEALAREAYEGRLKLDEVDHEANHHARQIWGNALWRNGQYKEAEKTFEHLRNVYKRELGEDDPLTLKAMNNLALLYGIQGKRDEALKMLEECLTKNRHLFGDEHETTLSVMNNIGVLYFNERRHVEAAKIFQELLEVYTRKFGPNHRDVIDARANLAAQYNGLGQADRARSEFESIIEAAQQVFGPKNSATLTFKSNLAGLLMRAGETEEAIATFREILTIRQKRLDADHPYVIFSAINLANALNTAGELKEALPIAEEALRSALRTHGKGHFRTIAAQVSVAKILQKQGRFNEAEIAFGELIAYYEQDPAEHAQGYCSALQMMAYVYRDQGNFDDMRRMLDIQLEQARTYLGQKSNSVASALNDIGWIHNKAGNLTDAEHYYRQSLELKEELNGPDHRETLNTRKNLAFTLRDQGNYEQAIEALRSCIASPGFADISDLRAWATRSGLGLSLIRVGEFEEAEQILLHSHEQLISQITPDHPYITISTERLVELYDAWGKPDEAAKWRANLNELED